MLVLLACMLMSADCTETVSGPRGWEAALAADTPVPVVSPRGWAAALAAAAGKPIYASPWSGLVAAQTPGNNVLR